MIDDLDKTIKEFLKKKLPPDWTNINITFDMPTKELPKDQPGQTVNFYLYDIRENHELRSNEGYQSRNGLTVRETRSPVRVDLTYLISVWADDISDEHKLLGALLNTLLNYPVIPDEFLQDAMSSQPMPIHAWIAQGERTPNAWDFWGGFDGRMKAGISYVVTLAVNPLEAMEVGVVTQKVIKIKTDV